MEETQTIQKCKKCGENLNEEDYIFMGYCENCYNKYVDSEVAQYNQIEENNKNVDTIENIELTKELTVPFIVLVVCFFIPFAGLIIYACNISHNRKFANKCGKASLFGIIIPIIIIVLVQFFAHLYNEQAKKEFKQQLEITKQEEAEELKRIEEESKKIKEELYYKELKDFNGRLEKYEGIQDLEAIKALKKEIEYLVYNTDYPLWTTYNGELYGKLNYSENLKYNVSFTKSIDNRIWSVDISENKQ